MKLFDIYHSLRDRQSVTCFASAFDAWRVRISRIDGGCECDFFCKSDGLCECAFFRWSDGSCCCDCRCRPDGGCDLVSRGSGWRKVSKEQMNEDLLDRMLTADAWEPGEAAEIGGHRRHER